MIEERLLDGVWSAVGDFGIGTALAHLATFMMEATLRNRGIEQICLSMELYS